MLKYSQQILNLTLKAISTKTVPSTSEIKDERTERSCSCAQLVITGKLACKLVNNFEQGKKNMFVFDFGLTNSRTTKVAKSYCAFSTGDPGVEFSPESRLGL